MAFQGDSIYWVELEKIVPNPFQPRREFDESKLKELAESIRMYGVLQPLTVTRKEIQEENGTFYTEYELIAGERRLRASKIAGVAQVPVIIREGEQSEQEKLEIAIIENLQREDLNAVDRALAFKQLAESFRMSHTQVAKKVGRSREYVSNTIRLLGLPDHMIHTLKIGDMMEGHARTLLMLGDRPDEQEVVYKEILLKKLSVREVERIVRKIATDKVRKKDPNEFDVNLIEFEKKFTETLGTRVQIQKTDFGGKLTIDYFSVDDLEAILQRMKEEESQREPTEHEAVSRLAAHTPLVVIPGSEINNTPIPTEPTEPFVERASSVESEPATETSEQEPEPAPESEPEPEPEVEEDMGPEITIGNTETEESAVASYTPKEDIESTPEPATEIPEVPQAPEPTPEEELTPIPPAEEEEKENRDDSGLYSIRNFSV